LLPDFCLCFDLLISFEKKHMSTIELTNVIKRYGTGDKATQVIHGVTASIADGEFIVIVGPSGCGKSTLLRMVAGLEGISGGTISIGGKVVNDVQPAERDIAMVFQNYALYPHMSVFDNMAYGLKIRKLSADDIKARVNKAAKTLELSHLLDRKPGQLSGGQRQRVAMGRAIVREPQVFLFDEPLSNLDAKLRAQTRLEIQKLHAELGVTSLFVTHDQVEAMTLAQRMIVLNAGRVEQIDTPMQVYAKPASTFVASFIGAPPMNIITIESIAKEVHSLLGYAEFFAFNTAKAHFVGVRPEHLSLAAKHETSAAQGMAAQVDLIETLGAERLIHTRVGANVIIVRQSSEIAPPVLGETVYLAAAAPHLHWFDQAGLRIEPGVTSTA
jgi:sn-glycerol 3-phosphate transport system ATP-binding protein